LTLSFRQNLEVEVWAWRLPVLSLSHMAAGLGLPPIPDVAQP
jgi:hypothetical protein